ncbi:MAG: amino acid synthesis family protein [Candidatus Nanopelagicales bacterium]
MSEPLIRVRKRSVTVETTFHEFGPVAPVPLRAASGVIVVANPYAGRYVEDLLPFMAALRPVAAELATEVARRLGGADSVEAYGKGAIVGVNGELEHGAVWHEAGGWAMRSVLGEPKAIVPSSKAVASTGYRLMVPMHYVHASYVRSHFNVMEIGVQDAPRPDEIVFGLVMASGGRIHERLGGLTKDAVSDHDGQR